MSTPAEQLASLVKRQCSVPGCITLLSAHAHPEDDLCSGCHHRPACPVCAGRGVVGGNAGRGRRRGRPQNPDKLCYRCAGTGKRPDSQLEVRRQALTWKRGWTHGVPRP